MWQRRARVDTSQSCDTALFIYRWRFGREIQVRGQGILPCGSKIMLQKADEIHLGVYSALFCLPGPPPASADVWTPLPIAHVNGSGRVLRSRSAREQ